MAITGIREDEYDIILSKISSIHMNLLETVMNVFREIAAMNQMEGGFGLDRMNEKVELLLKEIETMNTDLETVFDAEVALIQSFRQVIDDYDT